MASYFSLIIADESRWHLDVSSPEAPINIWACELLENPSPIHLQIFKDGKRVDYDSIPFAIPVVSRRFADVVSAITPRDIQRIPAIVAGDDGEWEVLNVLSRVDCIDLQRSWIAPTFRGEKPGKLSVNRLIIDRTRVGDHQVFRAKDWEVAFIISAKVKQALEAMGATGIEYVPVA